MTDAKTTMRTYRAYILGCKRKFGTARGLVHYLDYLQSYLEAKREVVSSRPRCFGSASEGVIRCDCKSVYENYIRTVKDLEGKP